LTLSTRNFPTNGFRVLKLAFSIETRRKLRDCKEIDNFALPKA
jgi:hypothetical protein